MTRYHAPSMFTAAPDASVGEDTGHRMLDVCCFEPRLGRRHDDVMDWMKSGLEEVKASELQASPSMSFQILFFRHHVAHQTREDKIFVDQFGQRLDVSRNHRGSKALLAGRHALIILHRRGTLSSAANIEVYF
jgi:hypothetical protein